MITTILYLFLTPVLVGMGFVLVTGSVEYQMGSHLGFILYTGLVLLGEITAIAFFLFTKGQGLTRHRGVIALSILMIGVFLISEVMRKGVLSVGIVFDNPSVESQTVFFCIFVGFAVSGILIRDLQNDGWFV